MGNLKGKSRTQGALEDWIRQLRELLLPRDLKPVPIPGQGQDLVRKRKARGY